MRRIARWGIGLALCVMLVPRGAAAQGSVGVSITGVVKDTSGAVLPGVTVEASSPALIEKVRTTVTDSQGQYRIVELRPGTYGVTFSLTGFSTFKRDGLELPTNFTATVNVELKVGELTETVTVSGESPLVDVQNVTQQTRISKALVDAVPTNRSMLGFAALMPAVVSPASAQDVGGGKGEASVRISVHGGRPGDQKLLQDGMRYNSTTLDGTGRGIYVNPLAAQEIAIDTGAGGSAEYSTGGAQVNMISKDGGNRFSGTLFGSFGNHSMQADNLTDDLKARGVKSVGGTYEAYDLNGVFGGPLVQDRLWFMASSRVWGRTEQIANLFHNANGANPNAWTFVPDLNSPVRPVEANRDVAAKLTWQASTRDKLTFSYDYQRNSGPNNGAVLNAGTLATESNPNPTCFNPDDMIQVTWTRPHTNRLLFEGGFTNVRFGASANWGTDLYLSDFQGCGESNTNLVSINDTGLGFTYKGSGIQAKSYSSQANGRFAVSYVTGAHRAKFGFFGEWSTHVESFSRRAPIDIGGLPLSYTFLNGVPTSLTEFASPQYASDRMRPDFGLFAQDSWTLKRMTLSYGIRFDYLRAYAGPTEQPAGVLIGARSFPEADCLPCWKDIDPRLGFAYDLFGDGKTAVKASIGRYVGSLTTSIASTFAPVSAAVNSTTRAWTDTNRNFLPDCDLRSPLLNLECGAMANSSFGQTQIRTRPDPDWITGWGKRPYNWQFGAQIDHQVSQGVAVNAGFYRTWFGNVSVTDNLSVTPADYDPYCLTLPADSRLPGGGGNQVCGLYDLNPSKFGQVNSIVTLASKYGKSTEVYQGFDANFVARLPRGAVVNGGLNVGNSVNTAGVFGGAVSSKTNNCFVVDSPQQLFNCQSGNPYQARFKMSGSVPLSWGLQLAAVLQSLPGPTYDANFTATTAQVATSLGRPLSGGTRSVTVSLFPAYSLYEPRINQLDVRMTKKLAVGRSHFVFNIDLYNIFNSAAALGVNSTYGAAWRRPTDVLGARILKLGAQLDF